MMGIVKDLIRQPLLNNAPVLHHHQTVGEKACNGKIMGDDNGRDAEIAHEYAE
jgi:hypothetical protein